jgi:thioredoxin-related protein
MRKLILTLLAASSLLAACNSENKTTQATDISVATSADTNNVQTAQTFSDGCYAYIKNRDTALLSLKVAGEEITGDLSYKLYEKDSNKGTIAGEIKGDTIIAEYDFNSEGVRSIREIVFLKRDGKLYEGFGEVETKGTKTMFRNRASLKFDEGLIFDASDCK